MSGRLFGYARVSVASDADANTLENQRRGAGRLRAGLRGRRQRGLLEPARAESPEGCPLPRRLREGGGAGPPGLSLTEVLELLGWLRENGVEIISLRESID